MIPVTVQVTCPACHKEQQQQVMASKISSAYGIGRPFTCSFPDGQSDGGCGAPFVVYYRCVLETKVKLFPEAG